MLIGYARVSSDDQNLNLQKDALTRAGCERILEDRQSGAKADRPGLRDALDYARDGDTLTVWRLDRLSRSLKDLIDLVSQLEARGIGLKSLHESIDTTSSSGKLIFHVFGALAEFERNLIRERTQAGLADVFTDDGEISAKRVFLCRSGPNERSECQHETKGCNNDL